MGRNRRADWRSVFRLSASPTRDTFSENPAAASEFVHRVFEHIGQLAEHPDSGNRPQELKRSRYRQLVESPCRVFHRHDGKTVIIVHVMRGERLLRKRRLASSDA